MATRQLSEAVFDRDIRTVNYFNGRLLTADDLRNEQAAGREERRRMGRALGAGIAYGLEVAATVGVSTAAQPVVTVSPGLAIDQRGQTLQLAEPVDVALVRLPPAASSDPAQAFSACQPDSGVYVAGAGLFLLTVSSVQGDEGRALASGVGQIEVSCNTKYHVPGVKFRLLTLDLPLDDLNEPALLRNRVAYRCFGVDEPAYKDQYANLLGPPVSGYGLADALRPNRLAPCEVPLAVLYWTSTAGLMFLDTWPVRRRIAAPSAAGPLWPGASDRRLSEAEAMFHQFQEQILQMRSTLASPEAARVQEHFRYLPPVGVVPIASNRHPAGFHADLFFHDVTHHPLTHIEGARVEFLLRAAFQHPPLDLSSGVSLWLYAVRENRQRIADDPAGAPQPYVIFATGHMPFLGDAHFNVNRWVYGNYS